METNHFYFLLESYFQKFPSSAIYQNKDTGYRPHYYCFPDDINMGVYWLIPISSEENNYKPRIERITEKYGKCDIYYATKIFRSQNYDSIFLIGNMLPVTGFYIKEEYTLNKSLKPVELLNSQDKKNIYSRARKVLWLIKNDKPFLKERIDVKAILKELLNKCE